MISSHCLGGSGNPDLAVAVAREVGVSLGARVIERFLDGETFVRLDQASLPLWEPK